MFGKSFLISLVVRYLLAEKTDQLKNWGGEQNARLERWVRGQIPGTMWDSKVWGLVQPIIPTAIEIVLGQVQVAAIENPTNEQVAEIVFDSRITKHIAA